MAEASFTYSSRQTSLSWKAYAHGLWIKKEESGVGCLLKHELSNPSLLTSRSSILRVEGDEVDLIGKSSNYYPDSLQIKTRFLASDSLLSQQESWLSTGKVEFTNIHAGMAGDTLAITYSLSTMNDSYEDGERRKIPVLKKGTEET
ncbi:hypothetical protein D5R40_31600, partial [Okeania hirsuta]